MNENIFTEELSQEINKRTNDTIFNCLRKYYPKKMTNACGMNLLMLASRAFTTGKEIFGKEFISNYATDINNGDEDKLREILDSETATAETKYFLENEQDINSLPKVHKDNKEVLSSFIHEGICNGFKLKCEIVARLMETAESSQADCLIERSVSI